MAAEKKIRFKPKFKAEFSMGQYDYERYDKMLAAADHIAIRCRNFESSFVVPLYATLKQLYINFKPIMYETRKKSIDEKFDEIEKEVIKKIRKKTGYKNFPLRTFKLLEEIHADILDVKQVMGLGIEVRRDISSKQKWDRALKIGD